MNKNFLEHYMKIKPDTNEQKYLFLVDNQEMAFAILEQQLQLKAITSDFIKRFEGCPLDQP